MTGKQKKGKRIMQIVVILLVAMLLAAAGLILPVWWMETHLPPETDTSVILVLGAQVKENGEPSIALQRRMTAAMEAYAEEPRLIICCGGRGDNEPEAEGTVMRRWMIERGIPETEVLSETESVNTRQNLLNARHMMEERGLKKALLVTSDYHVARALALARQIGLEAVGRGSPSKPEYFIRNHLKEGLSWLKFLLESFWRKNV